MLEVKPWEAGADLKGLFEKIRKVKILCMTKTHLSNTCSCAETGARPLSFHHPDKLQRKYVGFEKIGVHICFSL